MYCDCGAQHVHITGCNRYFCETAEPQMQQDAFEYIKRLLEAKPSYYTQTVKRQIAELANMVGYQVVEKYKPATTDDLYSDLAKVLQHHNEGRKSRSSDADLARFVTGCLHTYTVAVQDRDKYRGTR